MSSRTIRALVLKTVDGLYFHKLAVEDGKFCVTQEQRNAVHFRGPEQTLARELAALGGFRVVRLVSPTTEGGHGG